MKQPSKAKIIVVTGVESTGKTTLTKSLAEHFEEPYVLETAREYLEEKKGEYSYEDLEKIARLHLNAIEAELKNAKKYLFVDTAFLVLKIWSEEKYGKCSRFILNTIAQFDVAVYILCNTDIDWQEDKRSNCHLFYFLGIAFQYNHFSENGSFYKPY